MTTSLIDPRISIEHFMDKRKSMDIGSWNYTIHKIWEHTCRYVIRRPPTFSVLSLESPGNNVDVGDEQTQMLEIPINAISFLAYMYGNCMQIFTAQKIHAPRMWCV